MYKINNYIKLWYEFFKLSYRKEKEYSENFILSIFSTSFNFFLSIIFFKLIYLNTTGIGDWSFEKVLVLISVNQIIDILYETFFGKNLVKIPKLIKDGSLDSFFTKPVNTEFYISVREISFLNLISLVFPVVAITYGFSIMNFIPSIISVIVFIIILILSVILKYEIGFLLMSSSIWIVETRAFYHLYKEFFRMSSYPAIIFSTFARFLFTYIIPIVLIANFPVEILLNLKSSLSFILIYFLVLFVFIIIKKLVWKIAMSCYTSTGS